MEIVKVNSEELDTYPIEDFIDKFVYNHCKPGTGKTKKIHQILDYCVENDLKVMVCMPNHDLIDEFNRYNEYNSVHFWGKEYYCSMEGLEKYIPGCRGCKIRCMYKIQKDWGEERPIIFIVPQHLYFVNEYNPDVLIVDESIENIVYDCIEVPEFLLGSLDFREIECAECPTSSTCRGRDRGWKLGFCYSKLIKKPEIKNFTPNTTDDYFFKLSIEQMDNIYAIQDESKWKIGGVKNLSFLNEIPTIIFNCATTDIDITEKMFNREIDLLLEDSTELENKIYGLNEIMTISKTKNFIDQIQEFFQFFQIPTDERTLIFTKLRFEEEIRKIFPNVQIGHYGMSRGTNQYEGVRYVVLIGRYRLREDHRNLLKMQGLTEDEIDRIEISEEEQAFHRARPLLYNNVKVYLLTNTLIKAEVVKPTVELKRNHLRIVTEIMEKKDQLIGMNRKEIFNEIKGHNYDVTTGLYLLEDMGYIDNMDKKGSKFTWTSGAQF